MLILAHIRFTRQSAKGLAQSKMLRAGSSRGNEAQISLEKIIRLEPPYVGCYFFDAPYHSRQ